MRRTNLIVVIWLLLFVSAIAVPSQTPAPNAPAVSATAEQKTALAERLRNYKDEYRSAQWRYSWAYHFCVYLAAILSALAAWFSKVHVKRLGTEDPTRRDNLTASMSAAAALLIAISSAGSLADRWQDNKKTRYAIESLLNQVEAEQDPTPQELEAYGKRLALIIDPNTELVVPMR